MSSNFQHPCRNGKNCKHYPNCTFFHSPENIPDCPRMNTCGCNDPNCPFAHPPGYVRMCPFMNTEIGCTNLNCTFRHPKDFVHACIFGANCKKRETGNCHFLHPDERGFVTQAKHHNHHNQHVLVPNRKAPPPPSDVPDVSTQEIYPTKDKYGNKLVYSEGGDIVGIIDNGHFVSFIMDIPLEVQKADNEWDSEMKDFALDQGLLLDWNDYEYDPNYYPEHLDTQ